MLFFSNKIVDLSECDRISAIMIVNGKMYISDCDHQECYEMYCNDIGIKSGLDWSNPNNFTKSQDNATKITYELFKAADKDFYGFDIFEGEDNKYFLTSHFPHNLEKCFETINEYAEQNDCIIASFYDSSYNVKVLDLNHTIECFNETEEELEI